MTFPKDPCYVCTNPIDVLNLGFVTGHNYAEYLAYLAEGKSLDDLTEGEDSQFVNAITMEYFIQFPEAFDSGGGDFKDFMAERVVKARAHNARLRTVIDAINLEESSIMEEDLYILAHSECSPEPGYHINLTRLDTPAKGIEWTLHLGEKISFNYYGWNRILESLYGRIKA